MCWTIWVSSSSPFDMVQELRSPSKFGTRNRLIQECWLKQNTPPPICNVEKGLNNVSKVKFSQQVEVQKGSQTIASLGGGGGDWMAATFRPGQSLTPTKKQACSRPLLPPSPPPSNKHRESVRHRGYGPESKWCVSACVFVWVVKGHAKVCAHLKALTQTWVNTERTTSRVLHFELMRLLNVSVSKHVTHVCVWSAPHLRVDCFIHSGASHHSYLQ